MRIGEGHEWKTAFNTPDSHYEYLVMPFGVPRNFLNCFVFVYLDDILVFSPDLTTHQRHIRQVLQALLSNHLYVRADKCDFHAPSVIFLRFVDGEGTISTDPEKVWVVQDWPALESRKQLQRVLGIANFYHHFIRNFSSIAAPLHALTFPQRRFE